MQYPTIHFKPPTPHPQPFTSALKPRALHKMTSESERTPQAPKPFSGFSMSLADVDGVQTICLGSTVEPPSGHHTIFLQPTDARNIAKWLNAAADMLDPPNPEWRADTERNSIGERIRHELGAAALRDNIKLKRKAKKAKRK